MNDHVDIMILMPVYNDWESVEILLGEVDRSPSDSSWRYHVLIVDDGSRETWPQVPASPTFSRIESVSILTLKCNLGHQRAIAIGLTYIYEKCSCDLVVVMDSDGEDKPSDIPALVAESLSNEIPAVVFAERLKRSESMMFKTLYFLYRMIHLVMTGIRVRVGNFSVLPSVFLKAVTVAPQLWNHYAATIFYLKLPTALVPTARGTRYKGKSKMNVASLIMHGMSAISVFGEKVGTRLLIASGVTFLVSMAALIGLNLVCFATGRDTALFARLIEVVTVLSLGVMVFASLSLVNLLKGRARAEFIPLRDYKFYVDSIRKNQTCQRL